MTNSQRLAKVRASLLSWLADQEPSQALEAPTSSPGAVSSSGVGSSAGIGPSHDAVSTGIERESILVRDDFFCGRRFYTADHHAVWFMEEDQLKIYGSSSDLLCTLTGDEIDEQAASVTSNDPPAIIRLPLADESAPAAIRQAPDSQDSTRRAA